MDLDALEFDNSFVRELPGDPEPDNFRRKVHGACFSRVAPTPVAAPNLLAWTPEVARLVGLPEQASPALAELFAGNRVLPGMQPYAACYGGHQFGNWAEQLGDGRAITLGERVHAGQRWELQLKGAGPTPYSRMGDGRAVLRSSIREYLCSEAMHHLGVPTTRALALVGTGESVIRDMFYDGRAKPEPGAIVCRVAPSFLRFGNFELPAARGDRALLERLVDYAITTHFTTHSSTRRPPSPEVHAEWFAEVCRRTARMVAHWMRVGFVHGVMNTDNMSILGLTIDYGPYGWIDDFDPDWTPNTTDAGSRRYRFGNQPKIAAWNLVKFASALHPLFGSTAPLEAGMQAYHDELERCSLAHYAGKLGLADFHAEDPELPESGVALVNGLLRLLSRTPTDMTIFFRALADVPMAETAGDDERLAPLRDAWYAPEAVGAETRGATLTWLKRLAARVRGEGVDPRRRRAQMHAHNPKYVLRNYLAQLAIDAAEQGDLGVLHELLDTLRRPYEAQPGRERFAEKRPQWARDRAGCSMLSCSS
ncbi:protein adenylyltransferase SelO [Nannocystaceae bacterium ST9]